MALLEVRDLTKRFGGLTAVDHLSFDVDARQVVALIGPNGAGKTTTFNLVSGFQRPSSGTVNFQGRRTDGLAPHVLCRLGMTRTFQVVQPFPEATVLENVVIGALLRSHGVASGRELAHRVLQRTGLDKKENTMAGRLTLLDLKRLEIARALATEPRLLLLDEVAAGLKAREIDEVLDLLREVNSSGVSILLVEHVMDVIQGIAQKTIVLDFGRKIAEGTFQEISQDKAVLEAYLGVEEPA